RVLAGGLRLPSDLRRHAGALRAADPERLAARAGAHDRSCGASGVKSVRGAEASTRLLRTAANLVMPPSATRPRPTCRPFVRAVGPRSATAARTPGPKA